MEIKEVTTAKELKAFVRFPRQLYKGCSHFVPALDKGELRALREHPALAFCTLKLWLAYQDGQVVGRIGGLINHKCNKSKNNNLKCIKVKECFRTCSCTYRCTKQNNYDIHKSITCCLCKLSNNT